jgi:hypothetical protein
MREILHAAELPSEWDALTGDNYALKRDFLACLERCNPCHQRYYLFEDAQGRVDSILMTIRVRMNLAQYSPFTFRVPVTLVHVPLSVVRPALVMGEATRHEVETFVRGLRGYSIVLNWRGEPGFAGMASGPMSPQVSLAIRWKRFEDYLADLRSNYRYRFRKATRKGAGLTYRFLEDNREFSPELYGFYSRLFDKSRIRIERLSLEYFRQAPGKILVCERDGEPVGFVQLIDNHPELVWSFVGYHPELNHECDIYLNLLLQMIRLAIEGGYTTLEMGQTAEDAKLKVGGRFTPLRVLVQHSHPLFNWFMHRTMPFLGWRPVPDQFHVFREEAP